MRIDTPNANRDNALRIFDDIGRDGAAMKLTKLTAIAMIAAITLVGGCSSDQITAKSVRKDMSPELVSLAHQSEQRRNMHARTHDTNKRQIWDDLDRILLLDRPTRLSEYPIP
jgi:hypothetical protein